MCTWRDKGRVYGRGEGTRIYVGVWFQCLFILIAVDDVNLSPPYYKVYKGDVVSDDLVFLPSNNGRCTKEPDD